MVHIQAVNFLYRGAYLDERYPDVAKVGNGDVLILYANVELAAYAVSRLDNATVGGRAINVHISRTPMDFGFARDGSFIKGQTRFGGRLWSCPPGAIDPRF